MLRVLLVIEDTNQLNNIKIVLNKLGCSIDTQSVELGLKDRVMAFRPDVVITGGLGKKVNPSAVAQKVREIKIDIKIVIMFAKGVKLSLDDLASNKYDAFIESPFDPMRLISILNKFKGKNSIDLVEKYQKLMTGMIGSSSEVHVVGKAGQDEAVSRSVFGSKFVTTVSPEARLEKSKDLTFGIEVAPVSTISKEAVRARMTEMQKDWDRDQLEKIDIEKRKFVDKLFQKK